MITADTITDEPPARAPRAARVVDAALDEDAGDGGEGDRPRAPSRPACSKCGEPGHNARSCGRAPKGKPHAKLGAPPSPAFAAEVGGGGKSVVIASEEDDDDEEEEDKEEEDKEDEEDEEDDEQPRSAPTTFAAPKRDRFAEIEALARRRQEGRRR